jgi:sigma-E factor negative regulatory protein RseB
MSSNERDQVMEQMAFNQLTLLNTQNMDWFQPHIDPKKQYVMEEQVSRSSSVDAENWSVERLPTGYRKIDQIKRMVPGKNVPLTHIVYSDGLASVSLFIEPLTKHMRPKTGSTSLGATNIYANIVEGHQIMVVGEVPEATVAQIASNVSFKK